MLQKLKNSASSRRTFYKTYIFPFYLFSVDEKKVWNLQMIQRSITPTKERRILAVCMMILIFLYSFLYDLSKYYDCKYIFIYVVYSFLSLCTFLAHRHSTTTATTTIIIIFYVDTIRVYVFNIKYRVSATEERKRKKNV